MAVLYLQNISKELKAKFKAWCARNNTSMKKKVIDLMRKTIGEGEPWNSKSSSENEASSSSTPANTTMPQ